MSARAFLPATFMLSACFPGDEFPRDATADEAREMLASCGLQFARVAAQEEGSRHLMVEISEKEPHWLKKQACLENEADRRQVSIGTVGPLPS